MDIQKLLSDFEYFLKKNNRKECEKILEELKDNLEKLSKEELIKVIDFINKVHVKV